MTYDRLHRIKSPEHLPVSGDFRGKATADAWTVSVAFPFLINNRLQTTSWNRGRNRRFAPQIKVLQNPSDQRVPLGALFRLSGPIKTKKPRTHITRRRMKASMASFIYVYFFVANLTASAVCIVYFYTEIFSYCQSHSYEGDMISNYFLWLSLSLGVNQPQVGRIIGPNTRILLSTSNHTFRWPSIR